MSLNCWGQILALDYTKHSSEQINVQEGLKQFSVTFQSRNSLVEDFLF